MHRHANRESRPVEGKDASFGLHADTDNWGHDERFKDPTRSQNALHGLDNLADPDRQAIKRELGPGGKRPRGEGALAVFRLREVVVGLLDVGSGEVRLGRLCVNGER